MNIFEILNNLFTNQRADWILELDDADIKPVIIQRFLALSNQSRKQARVLNKFVFTLPPKMYLSSAWSVLFFNGKKLSKAPFIKYPKKPDEVKQYDFIYDKVKRQFEMSETDFKVVKPFVKKSIDDDKIAWFSYYGGTNADWKKNEMDMSAMKEYNERSTVKKPKDLSSWM